MAIRNLDRRASAIFPLYIMEGYTNHINFLSYWKFKNQYERVEMKLTFRDRSGSVIHNSEIEITNNPKSYDVNLNEIIEKETNGLRIGFALSVEVEVFFEKEPYIKYPALVFEIRNPAHSSTVHSCLRSLNPSENDPGDDQLPQTGFDVFLGMGIDNYIIFIGGDVQEQYNFEVSIIDAGNNLIEKHNLELKNYGSNRLFHISIDDLVNPENISVDERYKIGVKHDVRDVFPRFYVGNISKEGLPTLTHTFFDTSDLSGEQRLPEQVECESNFASFSIPILDDGQFNTSISSYRANIFWDGKVVVKLIDIYGVVLALKLLSKSDFIIFQTIGKLFIKDIFSEQLASQDFLVCKFELYGDKHPERFKLGLNISRYGLENSGTNICFSPTIVEERMSSKEVSSSWCPIGGPSRFQAIFHNTWVLDGPRESAVEVFIFSSTGEKLSLDFRLASDGALVLSCEEHSRINCFLDGDLGYCFFRSENPYYSAWYLSVGPNGVGGDHAF